MSRQPGAPMSDADAAIAWLRKEIATDAAGVQRPGQGETWSRWRYLAAVGERDLVHARLVEGHLDALAIVHELGRPDLVADPDCCWGVWAAAPAELVARRAGRGWRLTGQKPYSSGSTALDGALVSAVAEDGHRLFALGADELAAARVMEGSWPAVGMAATASHTLALDVNLSADAAVGDPGAYVARPGFWWGGAGVAACWWGGANGLLARLQPAPDEWAGAALGLLAARLGAVGAWASRLAEQIDADPREFPALRVEVTGLRVAAADAGRFGVEQAGAVFGTSRLGRDANTARHVADLQVYLTQLHRDRDASAYLAMRGKACRDR